MSLANEETSRVVYANNIHLPRESCPRYQQEHMLRIDMSKIDVSKR